MYIFLQSEHIINYLSRLNPGGDSFKFQCFNVLKSSNINK